MSSRPTFVHRLPYLVLAVFVCITCAPGIHAEPLPPIVLSYPDGCRFQDGFPAGHHVDVLSVGNADISLNLHHGIIPELPDRVGDTLNVVGPDQNPDPYFTQLWFRVRREGPGQVQIPRYVLWKNKFIDFGIVFTGETHPKGRNFIVGTMDKVVVNNTVLPDKFCSRFAQGHPHGSTPPFGEDNEIIWDNMLTPGTKIEYFVTASYYSDQTHRRRIMTSTSWAPLASGWARSPTSGSTMAM